MALMLIGPHGPVEFPVEIPGTVSRQVVGTRCQTARTEVLTAYLEVKRVSPELIEECVALLRCDELTLVFT